MMRPIFALVNAETFGFSLRARGGRTVKPEIPTMRHSSPRRYRVSVVSSVRHTIRCANPQPEVVIMAGATCRAADCIGLIGRCQPRGPAAGRAGGSAKFPRCYPKAMWVRLWGFLDWC